MIKANINQVKTHLSEYLEKGEEILVLKRNIPVAEIHPLKNKTKKRRKIGLAKGEFKVSKSFFEPLPAEILKGFLGE